MISVASILALSVVADLPYGSTAPVPSIEPQDAITFEDFPVDADPSDRATFYLVIDVSKHGKITGCHSLDKESGEGKWKPEQFVALTCRIVRERITYRPARMADGTPFAAQDVQGVTWGLWVVVDGKPIEPIRMPEPVRSFTPGPVPVPPPRKQPVQVRPQGDTAMWITNADYPRRLKNGEAGITWFRLTVGPDGRPIECKITRTSGYLALDERTCSALMRRARFDFVTDAKGEPIKGEWSSSVRWVVPYEPVEAPAS